MFDIILTTSDAVGFVNINMSSLIFIIMNMNAVWRMEILYLLTDSLVAQFDGRAQFGLLWGVFNNAWT